MAESARDPRRRALELAEYAEEMSGVAESAVSARAVVCGLVYVGDQLAALRERSSAGLSASLVEGLVHALDPNETNKSLRQWAAQEVTKTYG